MTLANMRLNGVRMVTASCANCGRSADVNVDLMPETLTVPEAANRLRCSRCGAKTISTRPAGIPGRDVMARLTTGQRRTPIDLRQQTTQIINRTRTLNPHTAVRNQRRQHPFERALTSASASGSISGLSSNHRRTAPTLRSRPAHVPKTSAIHPSASRKITSL
jgi:hypothetical protein